MLIFKHLPVPMPEYVSVCVSVCVCVCLCVCLCVCVFALDEIRFLLPQQCGLNGRLTL